MRDSIQDAIGSTITDMMEAGLDVSFTQRELNQLGVTIPKSYISSSDIKNIRQLMQVSQAVFAKLLNVSISSIRQWEQGQRTPSGSTVILLELLERDSSLLNYRLAN